MGSATVPVAANGVPPLASSTVTDFNLYAQPCSCSARDAPNGNWDGCALNSKPERFVKFKPQTPLREIIRLTAEQIFRAKKIYPLVVSHRHYLLMRRKCASPKHKAPKWNQAVKSPNAQTHHWGWHWRPMMTSRVKTTPRRPLSRNRLCDLSCPIQHIGQ